MKKLHRLFGIFFIVIIIAACRNGESAPSADVTIMPSFLPPTASITPSPIPTHSPFPINSPIATLAPDIAPNCKIANDAGQLYFVSDQEFRDLGTTPGKLDQALTVHYPEWANYTQMFPLSTQPVTLGEIVQWASLDEEANLQINPAVTLVTLGDTLDLQLPSNTDLYLISQEISTELNRLSLDLENPFDDSLRRQYPEIVNSGTFALYRYFNGDLSKLENWCHTYVQLFGE